MDHCVDVLLREDLLQKGGISHIAHIEAPPLQSGAVALGQVVHHHHILPPCQKGGHTMASNITGAAGYQN